MTFGLTHNILDVFNPAWLFGPIFGKELRVSSRRRRNYVMRFVYLALLTGFLTIVWLDAVKFAVSSRAYSVSRLAQAGKQIIVIIVWFQFFATQFIAVVMLSTAISDEITRRTLDVLMTTPITSFQIVLGKLSSKLLQLVLLLGVSLPLLAVIRGFGGVPWDYIVSTLCMTLTTLIFVGSLSLFFSTFSRKAYVVIILTLVVLGLLFVFPLFLINQGSRSMFKYFIPVILLYHMNPYAMLDVGTKIMLDPSLVGRIQFSWLIHCGFMLTVSAFILFYCVYRIRKIALAKISDHPNVLACLRRFWNLTFGDKTVTTQANTPIRRVKGPPVVWKELRSRISSREKLIVLVIIGLEVTMILTMYLFPFVVDAFGLAETHMFYIWTFLGLGMLSATVLSSTCITSEKESRSWPLLLTTTLNDWQILFGKFVGVLRRSLFLWLLLFVYVGLFWLYRCVGPFAFIHLILLIAGTTIFLCGTGFYLSVRLKHTSEAVITNVVLAASLWGLLPLLLKLLESAVRGISIVYYKDFIYQRINELRECYLNLVPFVQARVVMAYAFSRSVWSSFRWPDHYRDPMESTYLILVVMSSYILIGLLFAWRATLRFRQNIF